MVRHAAAFVAATLMLVPGVGAQTRDPDAAPGFLMHLGRGTTIGVSVRDLTADEVARATPDRPGGVYVTDVQEDGPAARAGVRRGDVIVTFDGERVRSMRHLSRLVLETAPGRAVPSDIARDGARQTLTVAPEATDGLAGLASEIRQEIERGLRTLPQNLPMGPAPRGPRARLGVTLTPLGDQLASFFGVQQGVLVSAVDADSPAARAGIRAGDVLTAIDGRDVRSPGDVSAGVRMAARGAVLEVRLTRDRTEMTVKVALWQEGAPPARI